MSVTRSIAVLGFLGACASRPAALRTVPSDPITGGVSGVVRDRTGAPSAGVTIVATSRDHQGARSELTDDTGGYAFDALPPGVYVVTFYYSDIALRQSIDVYGMRATLNQAMVGGLRPMSGGTRPADAVRSADGSTKRSIVVDKDYIKDVPLQRGDGGRFLIQGR